MFGAAVAVGRRLGESQKKKKTWARRMAKSIGGARNWSEAP